MQSMESLGKLLSLGKIVTLTKQPLREIELGLLNDTIEPIIGMKVKPDTFAALVKKYPDTPLIGLFQSRDPTVLGLLEKTFRIPPTVEFDFVYTHEGTDIPISIPLYSIAERLKGTPHMWILHPDVMAWYDMSPEQQAALLKKQQQQLVPPKSG